MPKKTMGNWYKKHKINESKQIYGEKYNLSRYKEFAELILDFIKKEGNLKEAKIFGKILLIGSGVSSYPIIFETLIEADTEIKDIKNFISLYKKAIQQIKHKIKLI